MRLPRGIKIECPEGETALNYDSAVKGTSAYFAWLHRGKESVILNLKADRDRAILEIMLSKADVLELDLIPGALHCRGLTPDFLSLLGVCK